jgi:chorismate mutase/prephenate dehydratase
LRINFPAADLIETASTSRAGELAAKSDDAGALGGKMVAETHGLDVLDTAIQDQLNNVTRFLVIGQKDCPRTGHDKTSIMFSVPEVAGALLSGLEPFRDQGVNLTKIQSRPSKRKAWEYVFFVDATGHIEDEALKKAVNTLQQRCHFVKVLGSYPDLGA